MRKVGLLVLLMNIWVNQMIAQNPFYGNLTYKMVSYSEKNTLETNKMDLTYGIGKYLVNMPNLKKEGTGNGQNQKVMVDVIQNKAYLLNEEEKNYRIEAGKEDVKWSLNKLDSTKYYFQRKLDGYLIDENSFSKTYAWMTDDLQMNCGTSSCKSGDAPFILEGKIPLIIEIYVKSEKMLGIYATTLDPAMAPDSSLFSLTGYKEEEDGNILNVDTTTNPKAPMDTVMEESEMKPGSVITDNEIKKMEEAIKMMEEAIKKMSLPERRQFIKEMEKSMELMKGLGDEDKIKVKKLMERLKKSLQVSEQPGTIPPNKEN